MADWLCDVLDKWGDERDEKVRRQERTSLLTELAELLGVEATKECDECGGWGHNRSLKPHGPCSGTGRVPRTLAEIVEASRKESKNG